jgi:hypothetical protein
MQRAGIKRIEQDADVLSSIDKAATLPPYLYIHVLGQVKLTQLDVYVTVVIKMGIEVYGFCPDPQGIIQLMDHRQGHGRIDGNSEQK